MVKRTKKPATQSGRLRRVLAAAVLVLVTGLFLIIREGGHRQEPDLTPDQPRVDAPAPIPVQPPVVPTKLTSESTPADSLLFFLSKLGDPGYTDTYGDGFTWYIAAEELGLIGLPAIPHLIETLDTSDDYERTQTFYALRLAAQHENMRSVTGGEYVTLVPDAFPPPEVHAELAAAWRGWYNRYFVSSP